MLLPKMLFALLSRIRGGGGDFLTGEGQVLHNGLICPYSSPRHLFAFAPTDKIYGNGKETLNMSTH